MYMMYTVPGFPANRNELANADKMYDFQSAPADALGWQIAFARTNHSPFCREIP